MTHPLSRECRESGCPSPHLALPAPGMIGFARIGGLLGKLIAGFQAFAGDGSRWTHVFVVLDHEEQIEAEPGGARIGKLASYLTDKVEVAFSDEPVQIRLRGIRAQMDAEGLTEELTDAEAFWAYVEASVREDFVTHARPLKGTRYGYLQYVYMGLLALAGKDGSLDQPRGWFTRWLARRITQRGTMICSQLADEVARRCGVELFVDKRLPQNVTPGDLAIRLKVA